MARSVVLLLAVAATALLAAPVRAQDSVTITSASPADGAALPPTPTGGIPWAVAITGPPPDAEVRVIVSPDPTTDASGALPPTVDGDQFVLAADPATPGLFAGRSDPGPNPWSATVGTFYWQVAATWTDAAMASHRAVSAILRLGIGITPAPLPVPGPGGAPATTRTSLRMSARDARFYVRTVIRKRTKRRPVGLRSRCARVSSRAFRCRPTWRDRRTVYTSGSVTFRHAKPGQLVVVRGTFTGRRASRQCVRTRSLRACAQPFRWRVRTAARPL